jgi:hypothetical protein
MKVVDKVVNLLDRKISIFSPNFSIAWNDFFNGTSGVKDAMVGFDNLSNSLIILRSPNDSSTYSNLSFMILIAEDGLLVIAYQ